MQVRLATRGGQKCSLADIRLSNRETARQHKETKTTAGDQKHEDNHEAETRKQQKAALCGEKLKSKTRDE